MPVIDLQFGLGTPLFLAPKGDESNAYYRARLPARMVGGECRHTVDVSIDGCPWECFSFHRSRNVACVMCATSVVIRGLGMPTILASRPLAAVPGVFDLIRQINSQHPDTIWLEHDDYMPEAEFVEFTIANAARARCQVPESAAVVSVRDLQQNFFHTARRQIVATEPLRAAVLRHNPDALVSVGPNAICAEDFPSRPRRPGPVRVGYAATLLHEQDAHLVLDGMVAVAQAGAEIGFVGWHPRWTELRAAGETVNLGGVDIHQAELPGKYRFRGIEYHYAGMAQTLAEYHERISVFDVAVAPLIESEYNQCKSPQKWFEHALHGTPMVVSASPVYDCVDHRVTGFKARNACQFTQFLKVLCADGDLRVRMGRRAREAVVRSHGMSAYAGQWHAAMAHDRNDIDL